MAGSNWHDIASKFDLPERQAKVKQLLKINEPNDEVWCICRSSDCSTFMIGCDNCDEWYHGSCIGLKERESKKIKKYYCSKCREQDPELEIQYKPQYAEQMMRKKQKRVRQEATAESSEPKKVKAQDTPNYQEPAVRSSKSTPLVAEVVQKPQPSSPSPVLEQEPQQCYGPGCCECARPGSKYCSDDCGMNLARNRIFEILPSRVNKWTVTPSVADIRNHKELEVVREERQKLHLLLSSLDEKKTRLEEMIIRAKNTPPYSSEKEISNGGDDDEMQLDCVSCGNPQQPKMAFRHMERCFARLEGQTTCWSVMSTRIDGDSMLCDYHSPQLNMYCKRLKHICPEHFKEDKTESEVCGCPVFSSTSMPAYEVSSGEEIMQSLEYKDFCRNLKSRCHRHISWDRLRRAHIDLERFKLWSRLEELMERENQIRYALSQRAGVVALMLNETVDCDPEVSLCPEKPEQKPECPAIEN